MDYEWPCTRYCCPLPEAKDVIRLTMALVGVGSLGALVLSLFITSGKTYHERQANELRQMSVKILLLGRILQLYGPEAIPALPEKLFDQIAGLKPKEDQQRFTSRRHRACCLTWVSFAGLRLKRQLSG